MNIKLKLLLLVALGSFPLHANAQILNHKSQSEIAQMTPEQRVEEYRNEFLQHYYGHIEYEQMLTKLILRDGLKAVPHLVKIINEYEPSQSKGDYHKKDVACFGAEGLLAGIDENATRLRGTEEGRKAVAAMEKLAESMKAAGFGAADDKKLTRYKATLSHVRYLVGVNGYDRAIRDGISVKHKIRISDDELLKFSNYLVSLNPNYPSWSETDWFKDSSQLNAAGYPKQYIIVKDVNRFYELYLQYKTHNQ